MRCPACASHSTAARRLPFSSNSACSGRWPRPSALSRWQGLRWRSGTRRRKEALSSIDPAAGQPLVSVIVPTYNRAAVLPYLFEAVGRQLYPSASMELIVVDNSSKDDTEAVVDRWRTALPFEVRFYRKENRGPAASRNYSAARARGSILAFTDSDCIPDPCWLRNAAAAFASRDVGIVCGPFVLRPREDSGLFDHQVLG